MLNQIPYLDLSASDLVISFLEKGGSVPIVCTSNFELNSPLTTDSAEQIRTEVTLDGIPIYIFEPVVKKFSFAIYSTCPQLRAFNQYLIRMEETKRPIVGDFMVSIQNSTIVQKFENTVFTNAPVALQITNGGLGAITFGAAYSKVRIMDLPAYENASIIDLFTQAANM